MAYPVTYGESSAPGESSAGLLSMAGGIFVCNISFLIMAGVLYDSFSAFADPARVQGALCLDESLLREGI
jgi:hypothetical protein